LNFVVTPFTVALAILFSKSQAQDEALPEPPGGGEL